LAAFRTRREEQKSMSLLGKKEAVVVVVGGIGGRRKEGGETYKVGLFESLEMLFSGRSNVEIFAQSVKKKLVYFTFCHFTWF
jgi:hypothetical protein